MKIVHVIIDLDIGGAELALQRLIEAEKENLAVQHSVVSLTSLGKVGQHLQSIGIHVHALGLRGILDIPSVVLQLFLLLRSERPDIVQTWMYHADLLGGLTARLAGMRNVVWGIRATDVDSRGSRATAVVRVICSFLSHFLPRTIVCVAQAARESHISIGYDSAKMIVIPNGFDLSHLVATNHQRLGLRNACNFDNSLTVVGFLGRFHSDKDQLNFVRAAGLLAVNSRHVRFLMVGRELDSSNAQLMHWIRETGFADHFVLLGERTDVPTCLSAMDIFCLSSRTEAFPNVVAEAMAMGIPCVVTDVGDAALLVADTGVVVPKENSWALANGLGKMLAMSNEKRQLLGQTAKTRIQTEFSMLRCTERFRVVYLNVISGI